MTEVRDTERGAGKRGGETPMLSFRSAVLLVILTAHCASAQHIGSVDQVRGRQLKFENTLIISWIVVSDDPNVKQVEIFDVFGHSLVQLDVLRRVPEARRVSIYDVSAQPGGIIAVAAVYRSREADGRVRPTLLTFDFGARLLSAIALTSSRQISRLALDDESNIWTLADHTGNGDDPSRLPMVVEYSSAGVEIRKVLTRAMFPLHAKRIQQSVSTGRASMGHHSNTVWLWLPGSTDLVTVSTGNGRVVSTKTGLPTDDVHPYHVFREPSGDMVGEFYQERNNGTPSWVYYKRFTTSGLWSRFKPTACEGDELIGVDVRRQLYLHHHPDSDTVDVCASEDKPR